MPLHQLFKRPMPSRFMNWFSEEWKNEKKEYNLIKDRRKPKVKTIATHQTGKTIKSIDKKRKALPPGKRISKTGKIYYEFRRNRSDLNGI
jgi:hypothetical protein